jgi:transposase
MPAKLKLELSQIEIRELEELRDHAVKPYLRERAAAILKIARGNSGREIALHGLLKPHWQDTIYEWVRRYLAKGIAGLEIQAGRGRKPAFSPSVSRRRAG